MVFKTELLSLIASLKLKELKSKLSVLGQENSEVVKNIEKKIYNYQELSSYSDSDIKSILRLEVEKLLLDEPVRVAAYFQKKESILSNGVYERNSLFPGLRFLLGLLVASLSIGAFVTLNYWIDGFYVYMLLFTTFVGLLIMASAIWKILTPMLVKSDDGVVTYNYFLFVKKYLSNEEIDQISIVNNSLKIRDTDYDPHLMPLFLFSKKSRDRIKSDLG